MGLATLGLAAYPAETADMPPHYRRQPLPRAAFAPALRKTNAELAAEGHPRMLEEELDGARLYTGPVRARDATSEAARKISLAPAASSLLLLLILLLLLPLSLCVSPLA